MSIKEAVKSAYDSLYESIEGYHNRNNRTANSNTLTSFIQRFQGSGNSIGFFFTLNQDLFVERYCSAAEFSTPGVTLESIGEVTDVKNMSQQLLDGNQVTEKFAANNKANPLRSDRFHYVKLHGSYIWRNSGEDAYMVIGKNKSEQISREPLLRYYSELFQEVLSAGSVELFVIGYGFGDEHINKVIADAIRNNGLILRVMNPDAPEIFKEHLLKCPHGENLWDNISNYYPYSISTVFPQNGETVYYKQIMNDLFPQ